MAVILPACWLLAIPALNSPCWVGQVEAAEGPRTACFVLPADEFSRKSAATLNHLARENFRRSSKFKVLDVRALLFKDASDSRLTSLDQARQHLAGGKEQYDNLELDASIDELTKAKEEFQKAVGRVGGGADYLETLLYLGAAYILSGDNDRGAEAFRSVAMFDKRKVLDPKVFPPSMIEIFNKIKEEVTRAPVGTVQMKSKPAAAEVYLNGVFKGITPVTLVKVPEGAHFVHMEADGYLPWGQMVEFYATHEETVEAALKPGPALAKFQADTKALVGDLDDDTPRKEAIAFAEGLGVERLVLAVVRQRGDELSAEAALIQVAPPKTLAFRSAEFSLTSSNFLARSDAFFASLYSDVKIPPPSGIKKETTPVAAARCNSDSDCATGEVCDVNSGRCIPYAPEGEAVYEKWWFWTIIGGGLAVAGGVGVLTWYLLQPDRGAIEFTF